MKLHMGIILGGTLFGWSGLADFLVLTALLIPWAPQSRNHEGPSWAGYDDCRFPPKADGFVGGAHQSVRRFL